MTITSEIWPWVYTSMVAVACRRSSMNTHNNTDRAGWLEGSSAKCEPISEGTHHPWRLVLLGAPGVGKGTQGELLSESLSVCHLSTGDLFRDAASRSDCHQTPVMAQALEHMRRGELVPDATMWDMVRERGACLRCPGGFLLDGFPRTLAQAKQLKVYLENAKLSLNAVVDYEMPLAEIIARLSGRRMCGNCKAVFHVTGRPPKVEGLCDYCGGPLHQREDDQPDSVTVRLEAYRHSTAPLIQFYKDLGLLLPVDALGSPEEICARTMAALQGRGQG